MCGYRHCCTHSRTHARTHSLTHSPASDYLQCCKFAEGDSRILMQKVSPLLNVPNRKAQDRTSLLPPTHSHTTNLPPQASRDRMRLFRKEFAAGNFPDDEEHRLCLSLATCKTPAEWDDKWRQVVRHAKHHSNPNRDQQQLFEPKREKGRFILCPCAR